MMEKYTILPAVNSGLFEDRLGKLYLQLGDYLDAEKMTGRTLKYTKVFLSDSKNQYPQLTESLLWKDYLSTAACSVLEQQPLNGSKISILVKTSDHESDFSFLPVRLTAEECAGKGAYEQTVMHFEKYLEAIRPMGLNMADHCVRTWIYVDDIDRHYADVVRARNDVFARHGLTTDTHFIASTGIGGDTWVNEAVVAMDFLTCPTASPADVKFLRAPEYLDDTMEYGVAFERGTRVSIRGEREYSFISGTASIDKHGHVLYLNDVIRQTGRLLENIGALLADGGQQMRDIQYFIIYLRDVSDYAIVDRFMGSVYPDIPRIILQARVCRPTWLIEMECVALTRRAE